MTEMPEDDDENLTYEDFERILSRFRSKGKKSYQFLTKAGPEMLQVVFKLLCRVWESEDIPEQWSDTTLIQLFKGKGSREDLSGYRFLHTKHWLPKTFEALVVDKMKTKLVDKMSKYQVAKAGQRPQEHLFVVNSIIALYDMLNIPLLLQFWDIQKFFDKESLRDGMFVVRKADVKGLLYRLWSKLNEKTKIKVVTGMGVTDTKECGEVLGQGSHGGAIISAANLDDGVGEMFENSEDEVCYGSVKINPLLYQDDVLRLTTTVTGAQNGHTRMNKALELKLLDAHPDKTGHVIIADKKRREEIEQQLKVNPLKYKNHLIKEKTKEKYLGDVKHKDGLAASIEATIRDRTGKTKMGIFEAVAILEDTRMQIIGGISGAIDIFELAIIPSILNNCETWTGISENSIKELENLQNLFFRMIFQVPISTPKCSFNWETKTLVMKLRIWKAKLNFYKYLQNLSDETLAKEIFDEQKRNNFPGLVQECEAMAKELGILEVASAAAALPLPCKCPLVNTNRIVKRKDTLYYHTFSTMSYLKRSFPFCLMAQSTPWSPLTQKLDTLYYMFSRISLFPSI